MYSYEDHARAVELHLKLGKRIRATIRQLGYPTKNSLMAWCAEFERYGDLQKEYVRVKPKYSKEQKNLALENYVNHGRCFSFTLKTLGYPCHQILTAWVRERYPETRKRVVGKTDRPAVSSASRQLAVYELCTREGSAQAVAQKLDVDRVSLYNWKNQLLGREAPASMQRDTGSPAETDRDELERQVEGLRRDIRNLQPGHDLLSARHYRGVRGLESGGRRLRLFLPKKPAHREVVYCPRRRAFLFSRLQSLPAFSF